MASKLMLTWLVLAASLLAVAQASKPTVRKHREAVADPIVTPEIRRAEEAIEKKDFTAAEAELKQLTAKSPNNYRAWFDLGYVYTGQNRPLEAIEAYRKSVAAKADVFESNFNLGILLARRDDPQAEQYLRTATQLKPSSNSDKNLSEAWLVLGNVLAKSKPQEAVAAYQRAATFDVKAAEPHLQAAAVLESQGDLGGAASEYGKAAQFDPRSDAALAGLANAYMKASRFGDAESALRKYLELMPQNANAHLQLGRVYSAEDKPDLAASEFQKVLQLSPGDLDAQRELAALSLKQNKPGEAVSYLRAALQKNPDDANLHHQLGTVLLRQQDAAGAQAELLQAVKLKPALGVAYGDLALAASDNKNYVLTIQALEQRAKYLPENPGTYFLRATAYDHLKVYKDAAEFYRRFLQVSDGRFPDQEWQARHRLIAIDPKNRR